MVLMVWEDKPANNKQIIGCLMQNAGNVTNILWTDTQNSYNDKIQTNSCHIWVS